MAEAIFHKIKRDRTRRVETETPTAHTISWVPDGFELGSVRVRVDLAEIARIYGPQAMGNKSGKSKYMGGCVVVEVLSRTREGGTPPASS